MRFLGSEGVWRYGLSMGNYCGPYMERLLTAFAGNRVAVAEYVRHAFPDTVVRLFANGEVREFAPALFADRVLKCVEEPGAIPPAGSAHAASTA